MDTRPEYSPGEQVAYPAAGRRSAPIARSTLTDSPMPMQAPAGAYRRPACYIPVSTPVLCPALAQLCPALPSSAKLCPSVRCPALLGPSLPCPALLCLSLPCPALPCRFLKSDAPSHLALQASAHGLARRGVARRGAALRRVALDCLHPACILPTSPNTIIHPVLLAADSSAGGPSGTGLAA